ncbi:hypothetical protein FSDG_01556 [Fusobacterium animalis 7_1]|uniref:Uncharacterized protein n=1 Tax=Fusobacterium animalis 7_1 TaxID=457405 RepID=A0A140PS59_9FUSO|nr:MULTISPECIES: hypothetical protein [Fusobacterium]EEO42997.1 hypothetical protein FSDG_01556 [Fusobacterium animalis 7_1]EPC08328.1 hypothetical protein HMPREF9369_03132 [Fusobacterium polymorphum F0401]
MRKIIELDIILPYYEAMYKVGKEIIIKSINSSKNCSNEEIVKEIRETNINCSGNDYLITTETGKEIWIFEGQLGLQIIWENEN